MSLTLTETDSGTKKMTEQAVRRTSKELHQNFMEAMQNYWYKVWETARQLCVEMGAYDTGTLYESIRLLWEPDVIGGGMYEVSVSSQGVGVTAMIRVGGQEFINPRTGKACNYAQAVHDGTRYMVERPFLTMAIDMNESYLNEILQKYTDEALEGFTRDF